MYHQVLSMSPTTTSSTSLQDNLTFAELGGDSRMAIEVTHAINSNSNNWQMIQQPQEGGKNILSQNYKDNIIIQVSDILLLSLKDICKKIIDLSIQTNSRSNHNEHATMKEEKIKINHHRDDKNQKRRRLDSTSFALAIHNSLGASQYMKKEDDKNDNDANSLLNEKVKNLDKKTSITMIGDSKNDESNEDDEIQINWQSHMLMCVDASPLLLPQNNEGIVLVGSQGGDIVCLQISTGKTLFRKLLSSYEKIEGQMNYIIRTITSNYSTNQTLFFVPSYNNDGKNSQQQQGEEKRLEHGYMTAFELLHHPKKDNIATMECSPSAIDCRLVWKKGFNGEIKSQPACFKLQRQQQDDDEEQYNYFLLTAGYDGVVSLLDALTGQIIRTIENIGGAIHASPTIHKVNETTIDAYLVSSTWTGRLSCIQISIPSLSTTQHSTRILMEHKWYIDLYCPFYASPTILLRTDITMPKQSSTTTAATTTTRDDDNILIFGGIDGCVRAISINNDNGVKEEKQNWTFTTPNRKPVFTKCVLFEENNNQYVVFGSHDGSITCLQAFDGKECWTFQAKSAIMSTPLIQKNNDNSSLIVVLTLAGSVIVLHSHDGKEYKRFKDTLPAEIFSSPVVSTKSSTLDSTGHTTSIIFGCRDSSIYKMWM